jgi:hypothetical protein
MKFKRKYTSEELNKIYLDFKESKLSKYAFIKKHKIGSGTIYKAIYLNEGSTQQKDETNVEDKSDSNLMLLQSIAHNDTYKDALKECQVLDFNNFKTQILKDILETQALLTKYTIVLVAAQAAFTIITLIFLS